MQLKRCRVSDALVPFPAGSAAGGRLGNILRSRDMLPLAWKGRDLSFEPD
jgi:hypothetical protein